MQLFVELGHESPSTSANDPTAPLVRRDYQPVFDEVEVDLEADAAGRVHRRVVNPPDVNVERDVPPVVPGSGGGHANLADDLHPQMQRLLGCLP